MTSIDDTAAANIRAVMARRKMSGRELAQKLGESTMWVHRRVSGRGAITVDDLLRIAAALEVPAVSLVGSQQRAAS